MKTSAAQLLVQAMKSEGIRHVFGVSGSDVLNVLDVIYGDPEIRYIQAQHEQNAMYMANGYARAMRSAGVCLVSSGPAITNCVSGVGQAYYTSTPSLLIGGEEDSRFYGLGSALHHDLESVAIFKPLTKLSIRVERADRLLESVQAAFRAALSGRMGPAYLGIPMDVLREEVEAAVVAPQSYRVESTPPADQSLVSRAADLLVAAERPVALAGGGLAWAQAEGVLMELAGLLAMPVAITRSNKGLIPEDHPLSLGTVGQSSSPLSVKTVHDADVLLAVGCTFNVQTTRGFGHAVVAPGTRIIQVDIDPTEIGKIYPVEVGIWGDARHFLPALLQEVKRRKVDRRPVEQSPRIKELLRSKKEWQASLLSQNNSSWDKAPIQSIRLMHDLRQALPKDAIVAAASGGTNMWFDYAFESLTHNLATGGWHPLGAEFPESLGVKVALPDRVVVCVTGDGSLMMTIQEFATAAAYDIPVLCVVLRNGVYGNMRCTQIERFNSRFIGTDVPAVNLASIAREFGAYGERVEQPGDIIPAVGRAIGSGKPALLEVMVDAAPENLVPPGRFEPSFPSPQT